MEHSRIWHQEQEQSHQAQTQWGVICHPLASNSPAVTISTIHNRSSEVKLQLCLTIRLKMIFASDSIMIRDVQSWFFLISVSLQLFVLEQRAIS